jgi:hypothetical protein
LSAKIAAAAEQRLNDGDQASHVKHFSSLLESSALAITENQHLVARDCTTK